MKEAERKLIVDNFLCFPFLRHFIPLTSQNYPSKHKKLVLTIMPSSTHQKVARAIHRFHTIAVTNQQLASEIKTTQTLWDREVLWLIKADKRILQQVNEWIDYAEEALAEANQSSQKNVQWAEFVDIQLFLDSDKTESASDCEDDKEEHYNFHRRLATWPEIWPLLDPAEEESAKQLSTPLLSPNIQDISINNEDSLSDSNDSETDYTNRIEEFHKILNWLKNLRHFGGDYSRREQNV